MLFGDRILRFFVFFRLNDCVSGRGEILILVLIFLSGYSII